MNKHQIIDKDLEKALKFFKKNKVKDIICITRAMVDDTLGDLKYKFLYVYNQARKEERTQTLASVEGIIKDFWDKYFVVYDKETNGRNKKLKNLIGNEILSVTKQEFEEILSKIKEMKK